MEPNAPLARVRDVRNDDTTEVAELYAAAAPRLIGYLRVLTGNHAEAEELAQDAFVRLLQHWTTVREYDDPSAWLRQVATRLAISRGRRRHVAALGLRRLSGGSSEAVTADPSARLDLDAALATLPLAHRATVLLHYVHDLSVDQVAGVLGVAPGTVKSRLARARAALQPLLAESGSLS